MSFNTIPYLIFLPLCVLLCFIVPKRFRNVCLLLASYVFFCFAGSPGYIVFLLLGTAVSYFAARFMQGCTRPQRLALMWVAIIFQGVILCFFKFNKFLAPTLAANLADMGFPYVSVSNDGIVSLLAPLGISYYTFATIGYLADVARQKIHSENNFIKYALFVSFFPQIISGPIPRADKLLVQLNGDYSFDCKRTSDGLKLMLLGFFKKIAVADMLVMYLNTVLSNINEYSGFTLIFVSLLYPFWLYCDFSGYSDIAVASAKILGIDLCKNFDTPLFSRSIKETWRRWHISLSQWLRDYIYIPLGGSRCCKPRYYLNIIITFLFSGIWHGVGLNFIIWGALQAVYQIAESLVAALVKRKKPQYKPNAFTKIMLTVYSYTAFSFSFIFFSAHSFAEAIYVLKNLFTDLSVNAFALQLFTAVCSGFNAMPLLVYAYFAFCIAGVCILIYMDSMQRFKFNGTPAIMMTEKLKTVQRWLVYYLLLAFIMAAFIMQNGNYVGSISFAYANY